MQDVTISPDGKITLPKDALEALSAKPGDKLRLFISGDKVKILTVRPVSWLRNVLPPYEGPPKSLEEMDEAITEAVTERALR